VTQATIVGTPPRVGTRQSPVLAAPTYSEDNRSVKEFSVYERKEDGERILASRTAPSRLVGRRR